MRGDNTWYTDAVEACQENQIVTWWYAGRKNTEKEQHKGMRTMMVSARIWEGFHPYHVTLLASGLAVLPPLFLLAPFVESQEFWLQGFLFKSVVAS